MIKLTAPLLLAGSLLLFGCAGDDGDSTNNTPTNSTFAVPMETGLDTLSNLNIRVTVDAGTSSQAVYDLQNLEFASDYVMGTIDSAIANGNHTFSLDYTYSVTTPVVSTVSLVKTQSPIAVNVQSASIKIDGNLSYPDNDGDTFSNLEEVLAMTDYNNVNSHPTGTKVIFSKSFNALTTALYNKGGYTFRGNANINGRNFSLGNITYNTNTSTFTGDLSLNLTGSTTANLEFMLSHSNGTTVIVTATYTFSISSGQTSVNASLNTGSDSYSDYDSDGFDNVTELAAGTGISDALDMPPGVKSVASSTFALNPVHMSLLCSPNCQIAHYKGVDFWALVDTFTYATVVSTNANKMVLKQWKQKQTVNSYSGVSVDYINRKVDFIFAYNLTPVTMSINFADLWTPAQTVFKPDPAKLYYLSTTVSNAQRCLKSNTVTVTSFTAPDSGAFMDGGCTTISNDILWKFVPQNGGVYQLQTEAYTNGGATKTTVCLEANLLSAPNATLNGVSFAGSCANVSGQLFNLLAWPNSGDIQLVPLSTGECLSGGVPTDVGVYQYAHGTNCSDNLDSARWRIWEF